MSIRLRRGRSFGVGGPCPDGSPATRRQPSRLPRLWSAHHPIHPAAAACRRARVVRMTALFVRCRTSAHQSPLSAARTGAACLPRQFPTQEPLTMETTPCRTADSWRHTGAGGHQAAGTVHTSGGGPMVSPEPRQRNSAHPPAGGMADERSA